MKTALLAAALLAATAVCARRPKPAPKKPPHKVCATWILPDGGHHPVCHEEK